MIWIPLRCISSKRRTGPRKTGYGVDGVFCKIPLVFLLEVGIWSIGAFLVFTQNMDYSHVMICVYLKRDKYWTIWCYCFT